ncbi:hypothetical protein DL767_002413 [Monosporascus sp. MG133]|nr:hypothetical protein DL767_002413 [Monosporascus sp. MG133]
MKNNGGRLGMEEEKTRGIQDLRKAVDGRPALEMQLAEERKTKDELEAQLAKCTNDLDSVQSQLRLEMKAREEVQLRNVELKASMSRLRTRLQNLKGDLTAMEVRLEDSDAREEHLREVCEGLQSDIDSLEIQADSLEITNEELEAKKERLEGESGQLERENEQIKRKVHGLESDLSVANSNIALHSIESIGSRALSEEARRRASAAELQLATARKQHGAAFAQLELRHKKSREEAALRHNESMASLRESDRARVREIEESHRTTLRRVAEEHATRTTALEKERDDAVNAHHTASIAQARQELGRSHDDAIEELKRQHAAEVSRLIIDHTASVAQARQELEKEYDDAINQLEEKHAADVSRLAIGNTASVEQARGELMDDNLRKLEIYRLSYLESIRSLVVAGWSGETDRSSESQTVVNYEPPQAPEELQRLHWDAVDALLRRHHLKVEELTAAGRHETEADAKERERLASQYDRAKEDLQATHQKRIEEAVGHLRTAEKTVQDLKTAHQDELARIGAENADLRRKAEQASQIDLP